MISSKLNSRQPTILPSAFGKTLNNNVSGKRANCKALNRFGLIRAVYLSSYTEFIGGLLLVLGFLTRPAAFAVMINMHVAFLVTLPGGFIMGGASYPFSLLVTSIVIIISGPMSYSIDYLLFKPDK